MLPKAHKMKGVSGIDAKGCALAPWPAEHTEACACMHKYMLHMHTHTHIPLSRETWSEIKIHS